MRNENIPIVMYHCINDFPQNNPLGFLAFSRAQFRRHLDYFKNNGYSCVTLGELWELAETGQLSNNRLAVLTFDDGYLDNYLWASEILAEYGFKGTVFVNPDFLDEGPVRTVDDVPDGWGSLNVQEIRQLERDGIFEVQSHTMTHDRVFVSDRVIDFYVPEKFDKYYWLAWNLDRGCKPTWWCRLGELREAIPIGHPVLEYDWAIAGREFRPSDAFVKHACQLFQSEGSACRPRLNNVVEKGTWESESDWRERIRWELATSKQILEDILDRPVDFLCFPGGGYDETAVAIAQQVGYKAYMVSSQVQHGNNHASLLHSVSTGQIAPLNRISFFMRRGDFDYWVCKLKVESFLGYLTARLAMSLARFARDVLWC